MPDGRWIAFASNRGATPVQGEESNGRYALYRLRIRGGELQRLMRPDTCSEQDPVPSSSGNQIAFLRYCPGQGQTDLWVIPSTGGQPRGVALAVDSDPV
jgi:Tol biopolymer transport system component